MPVNAAEFKLSITRALTDQLKEALGRLKPEPLTLDTLKALEERSGVYQLFHDEELVYVGKAAETLPGRLAQHHRKISGRAGIAIEDMSFTCLYVDEDMDAVSPEKQLIKRFRSDGAIHWNGNGFGNKDPGGNRDDSAVKRTHFDALYPIDLAWSCSISGTMTVKQCVRKLKGELPYTFRYQCQPPKSRAPHPDFADHTVTVPEAGLPAREIFRLIEAALPNEWLLKVLPGYAILYKKQPKTSAASIAPKAYAIQGEQL